jgi:hypothetical protein
MLALAHTHLHAPPHTVLRTIRLISVVTEEEEEEEEKEESEEED